MTNPLWAGIQGMTLIPPSQGSPLLNTAQNYNFPMTSGLLGALSGVAPGGQDYTQTALQMAGNPHAGPFATNLGAVPTGGAIPSGGNASVGSSGSSTGNQILGGLLNVLGKSSTQNALSNLLGLGGPSTGAIDAASSQAANGIIGQTSPSLLTDLPGVSVPAAATSAAPVALGAADMAPVGLSAVAPAVDASAADAASALAASQASSGGGAAAGLGAGLGATAAVAGVLAPAIIGMLTPAVKLDASYWSGLGDAIQGKTPVNTSAGAGGPDAARYAVSNAVQEALSTPQNQVPQAIQQMVWNTGLVPYGTWSQQAPYAPGVGGMAGGYHRNYAQ